MAMLESYSVKPKGLSRVTIRALDSDHLDLILSEMFRKGWWKGIEDETPVEIKKPTGEVSEASARAFR